MRRLYAGGGFTQTGLARRYGVSQTTVSDVILRKKWKLL